MGCSLAGEAPVLAACPADRLRLSSAAAVEFDSVSVGNGTGGKTERKWNIII